MNGVTLPGLSGSRLSAPGRTGTGQLGAVMGAPHLWLHHGGGGPGTALGGDSSAGALPGSPPRLVAWACKMSWAKQPCTRQPSWGGIQGAEVLCGSHQVAQGGATPCRTCSATSQLQCPPGAQRSCLRLPQSGPDHTPAPNASVALYLEPT